MNYQTRLKSFLKKALPVIFLFFTLSSTFAATVTNLKATYSNGQVFLTWTNPTGSNLQYNIYRSTSKFTPSSQLTSDKLLGFVRDNSAKNIHLSELKGQPVYYKIKENSSPLSSSQGLYVTTCVNNLNYYYAVTISDAITGIETKSIIPSKNSLPTPVKELVSKPLPVLQDSTSAALEMKLWYTQFVNNQETALYPAMNSTGSYGFNFYLVKRGHASSYPLYVVFEGAGGQANSIVGLDQTISNCYIIGVYDWLPLPGPGGTTGLGDNTYFSGYHENFNIYTLSNPIRTSGTVKMYVQRRIMEYIHWAKNNLPIDGNKVYTKGVSATGFGALLTALLHPDEITAVYSIVEPMFVKPVGTKSDLYLEMWGENGIDQLNSDIPNPSGVGMLPAYTVLDNRRMVDVFSNYNMPLVFDVHGKQDHTVSWCPWTIEWLDSLEKNRVGGAFYWDQRQHTGEGKNYATDETMPVFERYSLDKSYLAFSNCTINQDPGNGTPSNGDPVGAINGYLDWDDDITDNTCDYTVNVMLKDFYIGGVLGPDQYSTCKSDISFRRLQNFHPSNGSTVTWKNYNSSNAKIQNGSFKYTGGLMTIKNITINKSGNRIELNISNCQRTGGVQDQADHDAYFTKSANGYTAHVDADQDQIITVRVFDIMGRITEQQTVSIVSGTNTFEIPSAGFGIFIVELNGRSVSHSEKLLF